MPELRYSTSVRQQYESYPYPYRDPEDEKKRLVCNDGASLANINHYCYKGKQAFTNSFRALVAGGGTGDTAIFLAEQLRDTNAQIVYIDISTASMDIAIQRAAKRELDNIEWIHGSLLDLEQMGLGEFDYIDCAGVLHHLENPTEGLKALRSVLKNNGAMSILVYGKYGRTGVYQMQELMRMVNDGETDMDMCIENTKAVLNSLPETNWFKRGEDLFIENKNLKRAKNVKIMYGGSKACDVELYDIFLHSQDRAYTVPQLYEWLNSCGLNLVDFVEQPGLYRPQKYIKNPDLLQKIEELPVSRQQAIAELMVGTLKKHSFYVSMNMDTIADPNDLDNIPFFHKTVSHDHFYNAIKDQPIGMLMEVQLKDGEIAKIAVGEYTKFLFKYMNGSTSLREILELIAAEDRLKQNTISDEEILDDFKAIYNVFNLLGLMVLRHNSVPPFKTYQQMQKSIQAET